MSHHPPSPHSESPGSLTSLVVRPHSPHRKSLARCRCYRSSHPHVTSCITPNNLTTFIVSMAAKKRCQFQSETQCNSAVVRIVGQCPHCRAEFCGAVSTFWHLSIMNWLLMPPQHRLPEHHACNNLEDCRQQAFDRNKAKLESERTVASKMGVA